MAFNAHKLRDEVAIYNSTRPQESLLVHKQPHIIVKSSAIKRYKMKLILSALLIVYYFMCTLVKTTNSECYCYPDGPRQKQSGNGQSWQWQSDGYGQSGHKKPGHKNPGQWQSGHKKPGQWQEQWQSGHGQHGHRQHGQWHSGHRQPGHWNTPRPYKKVTDWQMDRFWESASWKNLWDNFEKNKFWETASWKNLFPN